MFTTHLTTANFLDIMKPYKSIEKFLSGSENKELFTENKTEVAINHLKT